MRQTFKAVFMVLLVAGMTVAQSSSPATSSAKTPESKKEEKSNAMAVLPSEATVEAFMKQTFGYQPDLTWKISSIKPAPAAGLAQVDVVLASTQGQQLSRFYVTADGEHAVVGDIIPFGAEPFARVRAILDKGVTGPSRGPKDAPVMIVEFGDLQCPACKAAQPVIEGLIAAEPNARFVFQNFPLEMHNWAFKAATYADCVGLASNDAFWKFVAKTYETQTDITAANADEKLTAIADGAGVKGSDIAGCANTPVTKSHVDASLALGKSVNVSGTPTLFVNGRSIGNVSQIPAETLKQLVDFAAKQGK